MSEINEKDNIKIFPDRGITYARGFLASGLNCGIRVARKDLALLYSEKIASAAAVYTQNSFKAAPLCVTAKNMALSGGKIQAILINSGIANACTGEKGVEDAWETVGYVAQALKISADNVAVTSTGKIGEFLPLEKIKEGVKRAARELRLEGSTEAAEAILTTDTRKKEIAVNYQCGDREIRIGGMAKGSGMIHPNMATMLAFISTDLAIESQLLQEALSDVVPETFNMVSVDGDTSTNDMVLLLANGLAGNTLITEKDDDYFQFRKALRIVAGYLTKEIARDGEGATKLIEVKVINAYSESDAKRIAKAVIGSPLVKTAVYGHDPNWGRILAAVGNSGAKLETNKVDLFLKEKIVSNGQPLSFSKEVVHKYLAESEEINILIDLKMGEGKATAWGCDLTHEYININTKYN